MLFVKYFAPQLHHPHADRDCNVEVYCSEHLIELETLGPLVRLLPGELTQHIETWRPCSGMDVMPTIEGVRELVRVLNLQDSSETLRGPLNSWNPKEREVKG